MAKHTTKKPRRGGIVQRIASRSPISRDEFSRPYTYAGDRGAMPEDEVQARIAAARQRAQAAQERDCPEGDPG